MMLYQPVDDLLETGERFAALTGWHGENKRLQARARQQIARGVRVKRANRRISDDKDTSLAAHGLESCRQLAEAAPLDHRLRNRVPQAQIRGNTRRVGGQE